MTDPIKPATRADVEWIKALWAQIQGGEFAAERDQAYTRHKFEAHLFAPSSIATLELWEPRMRSLTSLNCLHTGGKCPIDCECLSAQSRKLMEQYDA